MRVAEFTLVNAGDFNAKIHLTPQDISIDSQEQLTLMQVRIKASKMDQFRTGTSVFLAATGMELCPISAVLCYLAERARGEGPLFLLKSGDLSLFRRVLSVGGIQASAFTGHSFRIGAATTAAAKGVHDSIIKALRRWSSDASLVYIRLSKDRLAALTHTIALYAVTMINV